MKLNISNLYNILLALVALFFFSIVVMYKSFVGSPFWGWKDFDKSLLQFEIDLFSKSSSVLDINQFVEYELKLVDEIRKELKIANKNSNNNWSDLENNFISMNNDSAMLLLSQYIASNTENYKIVDINDTLSNFVIYHKNEPRDKLDKCQLYFQVSFKKVDDCGILKIYNVRNLSFFLLNKTCEI